MLLLLEQKMPRPQALAPVDPEAEIEQAYQAAWRQRQEGGQDSWQSWDASSWARDDWSYWNGKAKLLI